MVNIHCSYGVCQSDSRKHPNLKWARFSKPRFGKDRVKRWVQLCGRDKDNFRTSDVSQDTFICELHFPSKYRTEELSNYTYASSICPDKIFFVLDKFFFVLDKIFLSWTKMELSRTKYFVHGQNNLYMDKTVSTGKLNFVQDK